ncbi:putative tryptophan synthase [Helianthus annuus]|nr:putative tryptophan synthase [Helianthus annuus]KAJ0768612.1 putative tryptophan synthase [Helianthus annuus]KAJ0774358.1 putative tryptophan synthase [Helianthus annuus]
MAFSSSNITYRATITKPSSSPYPRSNPSQSSLTFTKASTFSPKSFSVSCVMTQQSTNSSAAAAEPAVLRPDSLGRFGKFGGKYVPETLMYALSELESAFHALATDHEFQLVGDIGNCEAKGYLVCY